MAAGAAPSHLAKCCWWKHICASPTLLLIPSILLPRPPHLSRPGVATFKTENHRTSADASKEGRRSTQRFTVYKTDCKTNFWISTDSFKICLMTMWKRKILPPLCKYPRTVTPTIRSGISKDLNNRSPYLRGVMKSLMHCLNFWGIYVRKYSGWSYTIHYLMEWPLEIG